MFAAGLIAGLNHLLSGSTWAQARLVPFSARRVRFELASLVLGLAVTAEGLFRHDIGMDPPDVTIRLPADLPFLLPQGLDKAMARATVDGNAEFATELSFVLRNLRWDVEEDLSRVTGDIVAHRLVQDAVRFSTWQQQAGKHLADNLADYFTYEQYLLVSAGEFALFRDELAQFSARLTRFSDRIQHTSVS